MLSTGDFFPTFQGKAVMPNGDIKELDNSHIKGCWSIFFSWPKDFTFVCPTEVMGFQSLHNEFASCGAKVIGFSTDSEFVHAAWKKDHSGLSKLDFPMYSDITKELSLQLGILEKNERICQRATFVVNPEGIIEFCMMTPLSIGREPSEVLRVLQSCQHSAKNGSLMPCSWSPGDPTL